MVESPIRPSGRGRRILTGLACAVLHESKPGPHGCLALLGTRFPQQLRISMLSLAIVDDIGAILVVAFGYSSQIEWGPLALGGIGIALVRAMALIGFRGLPTYFV